MKRKFLTLIKWLMTTTGFQLAMGAIIVGGSFWLSAYTHQWHWFQRSGALLVSIGVILSTRRLLRVGLEGLIQGSSYFEIVAGVDMGNDQTRSPETRHDLLSAYIGFIVVGAGTLIWAYGDLIECLIALNLDCIS